MTGRQKACRGETIWNVNTKRKKYNEMHDHPKLYDKEGNEVTGRPEEGVTYYDAEGEELKAPPAGHGPHGGPHGGSHGDHGGPHSGGPHGVPPKLFDKDGEEVSGPPQAGVTYYDADGNELCPPEKK